MHFNKQEYRLKGEIDILNLLIITRESLFKHVPYVVYF